MGLKEKMNPRVKIKSKKKLLDEYSKLKTMIAKEDELCNCEKGCRHDFARKLLKEIS